MRKQDRQGVRTPADIERKYNLGGIKSFQGSTQRQDTQIATLTNTLTSFISETKQYFTDTTERINGISEELANFVTETNTALEVLNSKINANNFYHITFYDADGVVVAAYVVNPGNAVKSPIADAVWVDGSGATITFPYIPTGDTNLFIKVESTQ